MIFDKKYDKFFFIWKKIIIVVFLGSLLVFYMFFLPFTEYSNQKSFKKNQAYTIGTYVGLYPVGKNPNPCYSYYYNKKEELQEIVSNWGGGKKSLDEIDKSEIGDRFLVVFDTLHPALSVLLVDYKVPDDIQTAPEKGWKEIPNWDEERAKGNTGAPWDRSKVQRPELEGDPRELYLWYGFAAFWLIVFIREIISFFEDLPGMLRRSPSYIKNELPKVLRGYLKRFLTELKETFKEIKETIINLPSILKKFWYGDN